MEALKDVSLSIKDGDIFGIIGMSGAGKSTLVRCINMLERPSAGTIEIDGCDLSQLSESALRKKRQEITMIFQNFNLLMQRNCLKNICFPLELASVKRAEAREKGMELLRLVGLGKIAINYGYYRYQYLVILLAVILLIVLVQLFQSVGTHLAVSSDKRLKKQAK